MTPWLFCVCAHDWLERIIKGGKQVMYAARKASWNPAGVEPIHWIPADINPGSLKWVQMGNAREFGANGINHKKGCIRGRKPAKSRIQEVCWAVCVMWLCLVCEKNSVLSGTRHAVVYAGFVMWGLWHGAYKTMCSMRKDHSVHPVNPYPEMGLFFRNRSRNLEGVFRFLFNRDLAIRGHSECPLSLVL